MHAYNITNYNDEIYFIHNYTNETKSIEEMLKLKNKYYLTYYCKNNNSLEKIVKIPKENGLRN